MNIWMRNAGALILAFGVGATSQADSSSMFGGLGTHQVATAGAGKAKPQDGYTIATNPALMSAQENLISSAGMLGTYDSLATLENVVIDNAFVGGTTQYGDIKANVPEAYLVQLGMVVPLGQTDRKWRAGMALQLPLDKLAESQTQDYYRPQYTLYQSDLQRIGLGFGLSTSVHPTFSVGLGLNLYFKTLGNMVTKMPTGGNTSSVNSAIVMRPGYAPLAGLRWAITDAQTLALSYVAARDYRIEFDVEAAMQILSNPSPLVLTSGGSLFYDPETLGLSYSCTLDQWDLLAAVDYEKWSPFDGGAFKVNFTTFTANFSQYRFDSSFHDIWVPRIGFVKRFAGGDSFRLGLAYRPTPTPDLNKTMANFLDSDRKILGLGYTFRLDGLWGLLEGPVELGTHIQAQQLVTRGVTKQPTAQTTTPVGYPSYTINGVFATYGLSLTAEL